MPCVGKNGASVTCGGDGGGLERAGWGYGISVGFWILPQAGGFLAFFQNQSVCPSWKQKTKIKKKN